MSIPLAPTAAQQAVIDHRQGTLLVLAAVGSGKTTTMSLRLAAAAAQDGLDPARMLALTFTNRAADQMRRSLGELAPVAAPRLQLSTFHGLCTRILRAEADQVGLAPDFRIADDEDCIELLADLGADRPRDRFYGLSRAASAVRLGQAHLGTWSTGAYAQDALAPAYAQALVQRGMVDFSGLVLLTRALFADVPEARERWAQRFDLVQVDEVQDTHLSEYEVLRVLGQGSRSLCLVGDLDQTIYGWRGSEPQALLARVEAEFGPVHRLDLPESFRSTRALLAVADRVGAAMGQRATRVVPHASRPEGVPPSLDSHPDERSELAAVARQIAHTVAEGTPPNDIGILLRTNHQVAAADRALEAQGVPHVSVARFQFFRRREIKDALALARLVHQPQDEASARRVILGLVQGVGPVTVGRILAEGQSAGLRLGDLLDPQAVAAGDPLAAMEDPDLVLLDTETTGLDSRVAEVIEIAAVALRDGQATDERFHALIRPEGPVGDSEAIHKLSDAHLAAHGRPAAEVFAELQIFLRGRKLVGHNIGFDQRMLAAHGARIGVPMDTSRGVDTVQVARRLMQAPAYNLGRLCTQIGVEQPATHRAMDDVLANVGLFAHLLGLARQGAATRKALVFREAPALARLRQTLARWGQADPRPGELLRRIVDEFLARKLKSSPDRVAHLRTLIDRATAADDETRSPRGALFRFLQHAALGRDVDFIDKVPGVRVLTMHQAKGLEFEHVYLPALVDGVLPSWRALRDQTEGDTPNSLDEERRLFYVAVTRARATLHLSWHQRGAGGRPREPSRFLLEAMPP